MGERSGQGNGSRRSFKRLARREVTAISLAVLALLLATAAALAVTGDLTQPAGTDGCVSETGAGPCADGRALNNASGVAVSPDGKSVYVTSWDGNTAGAVARFNRNTTTGAIAQPAGTGGCVSETGAGGCADGHGLKYPTSVAVSPDGKSVYVASGGGSGNGAVARLNRNTTTGALTQPAGTAGCVSETGAGPCADGHALKATYGVAVSADGKNVYVASNVDSPVNAVGAVVRFNRSTTTGAITQPPGTAGCVSETGAGTCADGHALKGVSGVAVSADGKSVYVAAGNSSAVARLNRNPTTGALTQPAGTAGCISETGAGPCADGHAISPSGVAVSGDGKSVYASGSNAVARLNRNTTSGAIAQPAGTAGCVSEDGTGGTCADGHALFGTYSVAVSSDGKSVYVASGGSDAVARLNRNTAGGAITQPAGTAGCVSEDGTGGTCADGHALSLAGAVTVSIDGKSVYVVSGNAVARFIRAP
jgi:DNA-binding beta-propeller fold protein YncE